MKTMLKKLKNHFGPGRKKLSEIAGQLNDTGTSLAEKNLLDEAIVNFSSAIKLDQSVAVYWSNLGNALKNIGKVEESCTCFRKGSLCKAPPAYLFDNWGAALADAGRYAEAISVHKKATEIDPFSSAALANLGAAYRAVGRIKDAMRCFDDALELDPTSQSVATSRLFTMNFDDSLESEVIAEAHRQWPMQAARITSKFSNTSDPDRIIRVGYVSADFKSHSCAHFLMPLIKAHDRNQFHVTAFSNVSSPDDVTKELGRYVDGWSDVSTMSDDAFISEVRGRSIDILVDCSGHTTGSRLSAFAQRAAPIQLTWLGYPNTTGLAEMDGRLTDSVATPSDMASLFVESLYPLAAGCYTYRPIVTTPPVSSRPNVSPNNITFGAFHNLSKLSDSCLALWADVLNHVSGSRLIIKAQAFTDQLVVSDFQSRLDCLGFDASRVAIRPWAPSYIGHFHDLDEIDIALDATPYNGGTTTCDAFWMGVPVVTLCGDRSAGRVGAGLVAQVGHPEWAAATNADYVRIARDLAADPDRLNTIRLTLRQEMEESGLGDAEIFARSIESMQRQLWQSWCATGRTKSLSA